MRWLAISALVVMLDAPAAAQGSVGTPLACRTDADCPIPPCGPCTPGEALIQEQVNGPLCVVHPCPDARPVCGVEGRCVIGPRATPHPRISPSAAPR